MAGVVKGRVEAYRDSSADVIPDACPVEDVHRVGQPTCFKLLRNGEWRACAYWTATTPPNTYEEREHPTSLRARAVALGARQISCQILCQRARANRPPGC